MRRRVVITGLGIISPIGIGKQAFWNALIEGYSGIKPVQGFDTSAYETSLGGEILNFEPEEFLTKEEINSLDRACQLGIAATKLALEDSKLEIPPHDKHRVGVIIGTTTGTFNSFSSYHEVWIEKGFRNITPEGVARYKNHALANSISVKFGFKGNSVLVATACAAGAYAVGQSFDLIRSGKADVVIAGGSDAMSELAFCGFSSVRSLAKQACRPFDRNREGLVVSEGAAILVLETLPHALERGARIYGEVAGYGLSCDASHMTAPDVSGKGAALSMQAALRDAGMTPGEIDYINAHGTGTPLNEKMETEGIKIVFGERAYKIPISSIKSMIGHTMGAAGAIEALTCTMVLEEGIIPPTINYQEMDPECDLNYVPNKAIKRDVKTVLSNSFAFGGNNASLIFRRYQS